MDLSPDPLDDCLRELLAAGLDPTRCQAVVATLRARWGGARVYVRKTDRAREDVIRRELTQGHSADEIARTVGVHASTIRRRRAEWWG